MYDALPFAVAVLGIALAAFDLLAHSAWGARHGLAPDEEDY